MQLPDGKISGALLFAGNFNYNLTRRDRLNLLKQYLGQWQKDLRDFPRINQLSAFWKDKCQFSP
ncbi:MAG UNVERIFIED_CONTAM: hypothetical protein LVR29_28100 [Microcystis novacekii LVE1205-3]